MGKNYSLFLALFRNASLWNGKFWLYFGHSCSHRNLSLILSLNQLSLERTCFQEKRKDFSYLIFFPSKSVVVFCFFFFSWRKLIWANLIGNISTLHRPQRVSSTGFQLLWRMWKRFQSPQHYNSQSRAGTHAFQWAPAAAPQWFPRGLISSR